MSRVHLHLAATGEQLRVLHVAPPFSPVPPTGYGGIERTVNDLVQAQVVSGAVAPAMVAPADSTVEVPLLAADLSLRARGIELTAANADRLLRPWAGLVADAVGEVDLVHLHGTWLLPYWQKITTPTVLSVYTDTGDETVHSELAAAGGCALVANSQRTRDKAPDLPWFAVVLEGLDLDRYPFQERSGDRLVFVGELIPAKGAHRAIEVARASGRGLDLIGRTVRLDVSPEEQQAQQEYLATRVLPQVDGEQICLRGELGAERLSYLGAAAGLLSPITWEEPFGRVLIEAMACGTPVIAFRRGAVPEVVADGVSGLIVDDLAGMISAVDQLAQLQPQACRAHVARRFNTERVARDYLAVYRRLLEAEEEAP